MCVLRPRSHDDARVVVGWVPDHEALLQFAGPQLRFPLTPGQLIALETTPGVEPWVMVDGQGALIGHVDLTMEGAGIVRICRVIIDPAKRGKGLGRLLLALTLDHLRDAGAQMATLNVWSANEPAIRTYRGLGFTPQSRPRPGVIGMVTRL